MRWRNPKFRTETVGGEVCPVTSVNEDEVGNDGICKGREGRRSDGGWNSEWSRCGMSG